MRSPLTRATVICPAGLLHCPGVIRATVYYLHSTATAAAGIAGALEAPTPAATNHRV